MHIQAGVFQLNDFYQNNNNNNNNKANFLTAITGYIGLSLDKNW